MTLDISCLEFMFSMSIQAASPKATSVKFKRSFISGKESMLVQGLDAQKKVVWTYRTKKYRAAQLTPTKGILRGNKVYVLEGTKIIVLRKKDEKKIWSLSGISPASHIVGFDKNDNIFITGYLDDYVYRISSKGKLLWKTNVSTTKNYWPIKISCSGNKITVTYERNVNDTHQTKSHKIILSVKTGKILSYY